MVGALSKLNDALATGAKKRDKLAAYSNVCSFTKFNYKEILILKKKAFFSRIFDGVYLSMDPAKPKILKIKNKTIGDALSGPFIFKMRNFIQIQSFL